MSRPGLHRAESRRVRPGINRFHLAVQGQVPGIDEAAFTAAAEAAKANCPVSHALRGTTITLTAALA